jgi:hypothetical protein
MEALELCMQRPAPGHPYAYELTLTRVATKRGLDDDGVTAALKAVRDAFAIYVHTNDGNRPYFRTAYRMGQSRVQGVVVEWQRTVGPLPEEGEEESFLFYDGAELDTVMHEHRKTRRYWKERMSKRLVSLAARPPAGDGDEADEEAAYDIAEDLEDGGGGSHESTDDG